VKEYFAANFVFCTPGDVAGVSKESEIKNLLTGEVVRPG
jgi:hypothetical protein